LPNKTAARIQSPSHLSIALNHEDRSSAGDGIGPKSSPRPSRS
jgi:hypothetical protein